MMSAVIDSTAKRIRTTRKRAGEAILVARPHPFSQRPSVVAVRAGRTITQILAEVQDGDAPCATLRVEIGGHEVPRELWSRVKPRAGTQIACTVMPAGGDSGRKWIRAVLMIIVIVVAMWVTAGAFGATVLGMSAATAGQVAMMLGTMAVNALVPPPMPKLGDQGPAAARQFSLTGTSNQVNQYGVIPLVIGEMRYFPPHAALPYTEEAGSDKYLRMMLDLGFGDFDVSDIRIGETPIASFVGVEYEITETPTLYTDDIFEEQIGAALNDSMSVVRTTQVQADEIGIVIDFTGLYGATKKGKIVQATAAITFEYRLVSTSPWLAAPITAGRALNWSAGQVKTSNRDPFTVSVSWPVASGQYEVRVSRGTTNWNDAEENSRQGDATLSGLRTIKATDPSTTGTTKFVLRIKASEQLNGGLQTLNLIVRQKIPVLVGSTWVVQHTLNPAWIMHWLLTSCEAVPAKASAAMMDLQTLSEFAAFCNINELGASMVVDAGTPMLDLIADVLGAGMGSRSLRDGKISVVWDQPDAQSVGAFGPANYKSFTGQKTFFEMAHALRVRFTNPAAGYITDEIIVLDDLHSYRGMNARGVASALPPATRFELLELRAGRDAQDAWRAGRYQFAQALYRSTNYAMETDIEMLRYTRGDVVTVTDDITEWGEGWGRVKSIAGNTVTLDETITLVGDTGYSIRFNLFDGTTAHMLATPGADETSAFTVAALPPGVEVGNIAIIGSTERQTRDLMVTGVMPSPDLSATITLVDHAPELQAYIANPPDNITSEATGLTYLDPPDPPRITVIISSQLADVPDDSGVTTPTVTIGIRDGAAGGYERGGGPPWRNLTRLAQV